MDYHRESGNKKLLYSQLSDRIHQYIKEEDLHPGDRLPGERKLAAEWKVSRPTLRGAIRELENQGVVRVEVGKGTFITDYVDGRQLNIHLAMENFLNLFEVKTVLERYSLEKAIPAISEERLVKLEDMAEQMDAIASTGLMPREMDHRFHRYIVESYGNPEMTNLVWNLIEMYETFDNELYAYFEDKNFDYYTILLQTFPYHLEMVQWMKKRKVKETLESYDQIVALDLQIYREIQ